LTFDRSTNRTGYAHDPSKCVTARKLCAQTPFCECTKDANCDAPMSMCYYTKEEFVLGDAISTAETQVSLRPVSLVNSTVTVTVNAADDGVYGPTDEWMAKYARMGAVPGCYSTGRYALVSCLHLSACGSVFVCVCMCVGEGLSVAYCT